MEIVDKDLQEAVEKITIKPGVIGLLRGYLARYMEFDACVGQMQRPQGTLIPNCKGVGVSSHLNQLARVVLENKEAAWLWMLNDDNVFHPDLLERLMRRNVDVVVPLKASDQHPYNPEIYTNDYQQVTAEWLQGKRGLVETNSMLFTWPGMLIRRQVFEQIPAPWFVNGETHPELAGCDLWFCEQLQKNGISIHLDMENTLGRIAHVGWWPQRLVDGSYQRSVSAPLPWGWTC